jgi:hypothetical protein
MNYKEFVKAEMAKMKSSKLPVGQRMKLIAEQWKKHKSKLKGGEIDASAPVPAQPNDIPNNVQGNARKTAGFSQLTEQEKMGQQLQAQEEAFSEKVKKSLYGNYAEPFIKPSVMMDREIPWILAQHPNQYSANPNQVLLYRNLSQFLKSSIYKKYADRLVEVAERSGYGTTRAKIVPKKDFRIVFRSRSVDDNTQYYLDCKDADEFMDVLDEAKDSNILVPVELVSKKFMEINKQISDKQAEDNQIIWQAGYQTSYDQLEPIIKQQQEEIQNLQQSSGSDWLSSIAEGAVSAFKLLI